MATREFVDRDGDVLWIQTTPISVRFRTPSEAQYVALVPGEVQELHEMLGVWLATKGVLSGDVPEPLPYADAIRSLAREEFEKLFTDRTHPAVLPLWESPASGAVSRPCPGCDLSVEDQNRLIEGAPESYEPCGYDPAADVTEPWLGRCGCGHTTIQHGFSGCTAAECTCNRTRLKLPDAPDSADVPEVIVAPRLMSALRRRNASAPTRCERCTHPHADHDDELGCTQGYGGIQGMCTCTWKGVHS